MIYIKLLIAYLKICLFSFGGAYGAIPLIRDVVLENQWMDAEMFFNLVALSESTPGPIMVNMATYVGTVPAGGSVDTVLVIEVDNGMAESISSVGLSVENGEKAYLSNLP